MISTYVLFYNLIGLFLLIGVGFFAGRKKLLPGSASEPLFYIVNEHHYALHDFFLYDPSS